MAAIGLVDVFGAPTGAQSADVVAELVSADSAGAALTGSNTQPSVSDDGRTIVFTNFRPGAGGDPGVYDLVVRQRGATDAVPSVLTIPVGSAQPIAGAISGNGCVVAYSAVVPRPADDTGDDAAQTGDDAAQTGDGPVEGVTVADPPENEAVAQNLEPVEDSPVEGSSVDDPKAAGGAEFTANAAAQVAADVIELRTLDLCASPVVGPASIVLDRLEAAAPDVVAPLSAPALSIDGSVVAFATPSSVAMYEALSTPEQPLVVSLAAPGNGNRIGQRLDLTADGRTVVFEAGPPIADPADPIDASVYLATVAPGVVAGDPPIVDVELFAPTDAGSSWPSISADGSLVVYQSDRPLPIAGIPATGSYIVLAERGAAGTTHRFITDAAVRPDLAANGTAMAYDIFGSVQVRRSVSDVPFKEFAERIANQRLGVEFVEGTGASVSGVALSGDGTTAVFDQPAAVALTNPVVPGAHVWAQATDPLFAPPPTTTTIDNTTTTTIAVTQPTVAVTQDTTRNTTGNTTQNTTRNTTQNTTRNTTQTTTRNTTSLPAQQVAFAPAAFEFAPTIINAGRRTAAVDLSNPTADSVTVTGIVVEATGASDFTVDPAACTTIAAGATCPVSVVFAPSATGERTTTVVATMSDGSTATLALRGVGAPEPVLSVLPGVAANGQVVAVVGSGFPAGATVEFSWHDGAVTSSVLIDDQGGFTETIVVLPNTATGPAQLVVAAQIDLFDEVSTTLLVADSSNRGNTALVGGGISGASLGR